MSIARLRRISVPLVVALLATFLVAPIATAGADPIPAATVTAFSPSYGSWKGGTSVVITGTDFTGATAVTFDGTPATSFTVDSDTQITTVTPQHILGDATISVTVGSVVSAADAYRYGPDFSVVADASGGHEPPDHLTGFLATGPDGTLWSLGQNGAGEAEVQRIAGDGTITSFTDPSLTDTFGQIIAGPDGNLWIVNSAGVGDGAVLRLTNSGAFTAFTDPALCAPDGIAVGSDGNLWVSNNSSYCPVSVARVTPAGVITNFPIDPSAGASPGFVSAVTDGNVWVASGERMIRVTPAGTMTMFDVCPAGEIAISAAAGPDGNLWVTCNYDLASGAVVRLTPTGTTTIYTSIDSNAITSPIFISIGADGNLWFNNLFGDPIPGFPFPSFRSPLGRVSFPDSLSTPVFERFETPMLGSLSMTVAPDGYMYSNGYSEVIANFSGQLGSVCAAPTTPDEIAICDQLGLADISTIYDVFKVDIGLAGAPTVADPAVSSGRADLSWTAPFNTGITTPTSYRITYSKHADMSNATVVDTGSTGLSRSLTGLENDTTYYVRIATTTAAGTGPGSAVRTFRTPSVPAAPEVAAPTTPASGRLSVSWSAPTNTGGSAITGYRIRYSTNPNMSGATTIRVAAADRSRTISGLNNGTTYYVTVAATNANGDSPPSRSGSVVVGTTAAPTALKAFGNKHAIAVTWQRRAPLSASQVVGYRVTYSTTKDFASATTVDVGVGSSVSVSGLLSSTTYFVKVATITTNGVGAYGPMSWAKTRPAVVG